MPRQYHIGLGKGELADTILLAGDPARAVKAARRFDSIELKRTNREFVTVTGRWKGLRLSVMSTGIGPDNTEIAVIEIAQIVKRPTFVRIGSCGALQKNIGLGDLVVSTGAVRLENTSTYFVPEGYPAVAHHEVVEALIEACRRSGVPFHVGLTATAPGFYGAQCRDVPGFPPRNPRLIDELARLNVLNCEMEASALFTLAAMRGWLAGAVCAVYAHRPSGRFVSHAAKGQAEARCIEAGMEAARILAGRKGTD